MTSHCPFSYIHLGRDEQSYIPKETFVFFVEAQAFSLILTRLEGPKAPMRVLDMEERLRPDRMP
ncbi:Hypothetical protein FKW44_008350 [Caligus rogercresseyi]|uniref:Uncharacterized protein n=1 Tax=Caligus rogercresseyi TaxID=217165 RepID=A0A7T8KG55_CALRO|nr:Hypothetical protein FKW44_008350 [Caligus rogercresseyi]